MHLYKLHKSKILSKYKNIYIAKLYLQRDPACTATCTCKILSAPLSILLVRAEFMLRFSSPHTPLVFST